MSGPDCSWSHQWPETRDCSGNGACVSLDPTNHPNGPGVCLCSSGWSGYLDYAGHHHADDCAAHIVTLRVLWALQLVACISVMVAAAHRICRLYVLLAARYTGGGGGAEAGVGVGGRPGAAATPTPTPPPPRRRSSSTTSTSPLANNKVGNNNNQNQDNVSETVTKPRCYWLRRVLAEFFRSRVVWALTLIWFEGFLNAVFAGLKIHYVTDFVTGYHVSATALRVAAGMIWFASVGVIFMMWISVITAALTLADDRAKQTVQRMRFVLCVGCPLLGAISFGMAFGIQYNHGENNDNSGAPNDSGPSPPTALTSPILVVADHFLSAYWTIVAVTIFFLGAMMLFFGLRLLQILDVSIALDKKAQEQQAEIGGPGIDKPRTPLVSANSSNGNVAKRDSTPLPSLQLDSAAINHHSTSSSSNNNTSLIIGEKYHATGTTSTMINPVPSSPPSPTLTIHSLRSEFSQTITSTLVSSSASSGQEQSGIAVSAPEVPSSHVILLGTRADLLTPALALPRPVSSVGRRSLTPLPSVSTLATSPSSRSMGPTPLLDSNSDRIDAVAVADAPTHHHPTVFTFTVAAVGSGGSGSSLCATTDTGASPAQPSQHDSTTDQLLLQLPSSPTGMASSSASAPRSSSSTANSLSTLALPASAADSSSYLSLSSLGAGRVSSTTPTASAAAAAAIGGSSTHAKKDSTAISSKGSSEGDGMKRISQQSSTSTTFKASRMEVLRNRLFRFIRFCSIQLVQNGVVLIVIGWWPYIKYKSAYFDAFGGAICQVCLMLAVLLVDQKR